jgi:hypothetical protein
MYLQRQLLVPALVAGLLSAALSGCGGTAKEQGHPAKTRPATSAKPAIPATAAQVQGHFVSVVNGAASVHVQGRYTWPHTKLTDNVDLLKSGQIAGLIDDDGLPLSGVEVGGKMYVKLTAAFAAYYHHTGCAPFCGKYVIAPHSMTAGLVRSMGWSSTISVLADMADAMSAPIHTTFHGQPALKSTTGYDPGSYVIVAATPESLPLEAVDPGRFRLTFSDWNSVATPVAPPKSKIKAAK